MPISARAEYACLAMLELASRYPDPKPVRLTDITDKHAIPDRFLVQILLQLKTIGMVTTTRGKAGGYHLARSPDHITLADIVGSLDGLSEPDDRPTTGTGLGQKLQSVWSGLAKQLAQTRSGYLTNFRLSDLVACDAHPDYMI